MDIKTFANSFQTKSVLELQPIADLLEKVGNPQKDLKYIHVTGTNGKGSVCAFLQSALTHAGLKCGKYTSPFVVCQEERISVDGKFIPAEAFDALLKQLEPYAEGKSPFELWTAASFLYFKQEKCDIVVLECGMGGKGDATNIIPAPECAILTRIGLDHTEYLGNTIGEITLNKCGIIKPGTKHVVTIKQETTNLIKKHACGMFHVAEPVDSPLSLKGKHQKENAGIAYTALKALGVAEEHILYGLSHAKHPARFEVFEGNPLVIYDGAHNPNGAKALVENLPDEPLTLICAFMADKDIQGVIDELKKGNLQSRCTVRCTTVSDNPRAMQPENLAELFNLNGFKASPYPTIREALLNLETTTCVFGSLYLYKEFLDAYKKGA
ncbi:MAG: bifunctional folylpolyglutamate synthase/dihydrofolate synthase [Clostridia bacterium]|nr:bifunctional folylpolyglutamate synthase/dihydrofolate synthase [Clostridia bacterium]